MVRWSRHEIDPGDVLLDASNLPGLDIEQFEGRVIQPVSRRSLFGIGVVFVLVMLVFMGRAAYLQVVQGAFFAQAAERNTLAHQILFSVRGVLYDRTHVELAWNESQDGLPYAERRYADSPSIAHLMGYVRYPKKDASGLWWRTEFSGVSGAEQVFDELLSGKNGRELIEVDAHNVVQRRGIIEPPEHGENITLTIDYEVQKKLYEQLSAHAVAQGFQGGAAIIMDVHSGELLALTSFPSYDLAALTSGDSEALESYTNDTRTPFLNRAISGLYAPGSIVKPLFAAAALAEKIIDPEKKIFSPGFISIPNPYNPDVPTIIKDWRAHGWTNMQEAIAVSSDVYFFAIGGGYEDQRGLGIARLDSYAQMFGLGAETGIALSGEAEGVIPTPEWKEEVFGADEIWRIGDTYNTAIGQYGFQVTPIQMVRAIAAIANGGDLLTPHVRASTTPERTKIAITPQDLSVVREGMKKAAEPGGTAQALYLPDMRIAGKTGTAEVGNKKQWMNSWVVGFWPYEAPRYAFAVVLERAPAGTLSGAAPGLRPFFDWLLVEKPDYIR